MNEQNFDYLKDQVKYTGFGDGLEQQLKEKMQQGTPEFQLSHGVTYGNDRAEATLNFKKSAQSDRYFFTSYRLALKGEHSPETTAQTFYIHKENNITLKEAYNLLSGRAVHKNLMSKEGQGYEAWLQLDFRETDKYGNYPIKRYYPSHGFNLEQELAKHPIKEMVSDQEKARLVESLGKGNRQAVTFVKDGSELNMYVEANPKFKSLNVYDHSLQRVQAQKEKNTIGQSVQQETKKVGHSRDEEDGTITQEVARKQGKRKGQSIGH